MWREITKSLELKPQPGESEQDRVDEVMILYLADVMRLDKSEARGRKRFLGKLDKITGLKEALEGHLAGSIGRLNRSPCPWELKRLAEEYDKKGDTDERDKWHWIAWFYGADGDSLPVQQNLEQAHRQMLTAIRKQEGIEAAEAKKGEQQRESEDAAKQAMPPPALPASATKATQGTKRKMRDEGDEGDHVQSPSKKMAMPPPALPPSTSKASQSTKRKQPGEDDGSEDVQSPSKKRLREEGTTEMPSNYLPAALPGNRAALVAEVNREGHPNKLLKRYLQTARKSSAPPAATSSASTTNAQPNIFNPSGFGDLREKYRVIDDDDEDDSDEDESDRMKTHMRRRDGDDDED